jgi:hypothetical protein
MAARGRLMNRKLGAEFLGTAWLAIAELLAGAVHARPFARE